MGNALLGFVVVVGFAWAALVGYGLTVSVRGRLRGRGTRQA